MGFGVGVGVGVRARVRMRIRIWGPVECSGVCPRASREATAAGVWSSIVSNAWVGSGLGLGLGLWSPG